MTALIVRCITAFLLSLLLSIGSAECWGTTSVARANANARGQAADERDVRMIDPGQPIKRKIGNGEYHYYRIMLRSDQYFRLVVDQRGIDVSVKLYQPDGKLVAESSRLNGAYGPETISWIAENSGFYKLEVRPAKTDQIPQYYEVKTLEERTATFQDRSRSRSKRFHAGGAIA